MSVFRWPLVGVASLAMALAGCGGGDGGGGTGGGTPTPTPAPTPTPTPPPSGTCSLASRQAWANAEIREFYLFPELLPASVDASAFGSVGAYVDALTATARAEGKDRFFTFVTSIAEENAFFATGSTAAFGIRVMTDAPGRTVMVADAFEGAPALAAGIDRGTAILAIGTNDATLRPVADIIAAEGAAGVSAAFGPATVGLSRALRVRDVAGAERVVTITKAEFNIAPISPRFGTRIIEADGQRTGYINMRTFIDPSDPALRSAFATMRAQGVRQFIIDLRYNGGGLLRIAELMGDLLGENRLPSDVFNVETFRPSKSSLNETRLFRRQLQSVAPLKIAFIGTGATASASELVINAFTPYLAANSALVGTNTFGKPVGQIARDRAECDDRLRITAFANRNAAGRGDYFNGLVSEVAASCSATDGLSLQMGDPREASTARALDFLAGRICAPITLGPATASRSAAAAPALEMLVPAEPTVVSREVPGTF
ncbi:peptidase S41 [Polymorphobacter multimanifer]|uniref:C-terminal processing protease CtpA/Prc n=1 Tax=Polymorphobacter multimanifer TaxID=1070431 RepID=A0A841LA05_9SPHN|nr:S41 family peptidase [Polymorphobacter multimanifer]MBB6228471.1 C-terminal processing protease CtpA/Prc [Polymorphobacter multimanifer]GGI80533.1 peptidase S41 [Polymorphobacter multimanifer]